MDGPREDPSDFVGATPSSKDPPLKKQKTRIQIKKEHSQAEHQRATFRKYIVLIMRSVLGDKKALESLAEIIIKEDAFVPGHEIWKKFG